MEAQRSNDHFVKSRYPIASARSNCSGPDGAIQYNDIVEECGKKKFGDASQWPLEDWT